MNTTIRVGIVGYGNLGRGVEQSISLNPDLSLEGVFTRRDPADLTPLFPETKVFALSQLSQFQERLDVLVLCGGSRTDLPEQTPELAKKFTLVDSFDTHAKVPQHFAAVDAAASSGGTTAIISTGWDPGLFSLQRLLGEAVLPQGQTDTFWGPGLSQGHSDALRRIPGVVGAVQYTLPAESAIARVRAGEQPELTTREKHVRECYVVLTADADPETVRDLIVTMPDYFEPYDTTVHFITAEELAREHSGMPHGGFVIRSGYSSAEHHEVMEFQLGLDSNPEFTASVLVAYARAAARMAAQGLHGAKTVLDVPPGLLSPKTAEQLRAELI